jgi:hypothetical protein
MNSIDDWPTPADEIDPFATLRRRRHGVLVTTVAAVALGLAVTGGSADGIARRSNSTSGRRSTSTARTALSGAPLA